MDKSTIVTIDVGKEIVECESSNRNKKRSVAWDHFEKLPAQNKNEGKAKCKYCETLFSSTPRSGTSHLKRHMERCIRRFGVAADVEPISMDFGCSDFEGTPNGSKLGKRISKVWQEFELFPAPNMNDAKAKCKHCGLVLSAASKNGTSHLKRHLNKCPKRVPVMGEQYFNPSENFVGDSNLDEVPKFLSGNSNMKPLQVMRGSLVGCSNSTQNGEVQQDELQKYISVCIIKGAHPFSFVEESGFRSMMSKACPQFKPFSRDVVRRELFSMYGKERDSVKGVLAKAPGRICLTVGNWKARDTKEEYICVTTHFIDDKWKLRKRVLCFRALAPPYDGTYIADELSCLSSQYNVESKTFTITVDEASYNESMVSSIKRGLLNKKALVSGGSFYQVNCCAHILNFLAQSCLKLVEGSLDRIRELVKYVNKSPLQRKKFFELAEKTFELRPRKRLRLDVLHRWSSIYKLLDRTVYYRFVFKQLVDSTQELSYLSLSEEDWQNLCTVHKFLKLLYDVTRLFSGSRGPSANLFLKGMLMVHCRMTEIAKSPDPFLANAFQAMQVKFDDFWSHNNMILSCAAILDPRYKVKFLEYCYIKLHGLANVEEYVSKAVSTLYCLFAEYKQQAALFPSPYVGSSSISTNIAGSNEEGDMFGDYNQFLSSSSRSQGNKSELDLYLEEPSYDLNSDLDVLDFWSRSSMRYPELSIMARDILSIPVSTANMKDAFSFGNKTLTSVQTSVMPETLQALLCLKDWLLPENNAGEGTSSTAEDPSGSSEDGEYDNEEDDSVLTDSF